MTVLYVLFVVLERQVSEHVKLLHDLDSCYAPMAH